MATYDKLTYSIPPYQEGNVVDFVFDLDDNFPVDQVSDITFQVRGQRGEIIMSKLKSLNQLSLVGRTVTILFAPSETKDKSGSHVYEIDFKNLVGEPFATIGGSFIINKEINTL